MTVLGELALWVGLFFSVWGATASLGGAVIRRPELVASGVRSIFAAAFMVALAALGLWTALLSHDFSLVYVAAHTTINTPPLYLITAFWAGGAGALLSWALALSLCGALAVAGAHRRRDDATPWIGATLSGVLAISLVVVCFLTDPYERVDWVPGEGRGLSTHLQSPLAAPHFIASYGAYAAAAVALTLAGVAASTNRAVTTRLMALRRWSAASWLLLTVAMALRMRWAYGEPEMDGLWSWSPSELANAVLWIIGAAVAWSLAGGRPPEANAAGPRARRVPRMFLVYAGVAILVAGVIGRRWWSDWVVRVQPGRAAELTDPYGRHWRFVSQGASRDERINYLSTGVALEAWRSGERVGIVSSERRQYLDSGQRPIGAPAVEPGMRSSPFMDLYVVLAEVRGETAQLRIEFRPLANLVWVGWLIVLLGAVATVIRSSGRSGPASDASPAQAA